MNISFPHPDSGELLDVEFEYYPALPGLRGKFGEPEEPDDEERVLIFSVTTKGGEPVDFKGFEEQIEAAILRSIKEAAI